MVINIDSPPEDRVRLLGGLDRKSMFPPLVSVQQKKLAKQENIDNESIHEGDQKQSSEGPFYEIIDFEGGNCRHKVISVAESVEGESPVLDEQIPAEGGVPKTEITEDFYSVIPDEAVPPKSSLPLNKESRKASRRASRKRRVKRLNEDNIYETVGDVIDEEVNDDEEIEFSGSDEDDFDSDSFTDDSDVEFEHAQAHRFSETYGKVSFLMLGFRNLSFMSVHFPAGVC
jgi:hypothetical protein